MLAVVSPGTFTITRCTSFASSTPASAMAACTARATFRICPIRPTSSGRIGSEPAMPTTRRFSPSPGVPSGTSSHSRVTATMCGVITPGHPPDNTKITRFATSPTGIPSVLAAHSRSAMSASTRPQSSWKPVPSVLPTNATSESGLTLPPSISS